MRRVLEFFFEVNVKSRTSNVQLKNAFFVCLFVCLFVVVFFVVVVVFFVLFVCFLFCFY